jgi:8-oxo-dGTP diphosphatase
MTDWTQATLTYLIDGEEVLLIEKKRGHGAGNFNGPGGKLEEDETPREAAKREFREETKIEVEGLEKVAELKFFFGGDPDQHVHVFITRDYEGTAEETEEARPEWFPVDDMPYDDMWPDDEVWMPKMFSGEKFEAVFRFSEDGSSIKDYEFLEPSFHW